MHLEIILSLDKTVKPGMQLSSVVRKCISILSFAKDLIFKHVKNFSVEPAEPVKVYCTLTPLLRVSITFPQTPITGESYWHNQGCALTVLVIHATSESHHIDCESQ